MAIRFPPIPIVFAQNKCYLYLRDTFMATRGRWDRYELCQRFGVDDVQSIVANGAGATRGENVILSYLIENSTTNLILQYVEDETLVFAELLRKMSRHSKCDATRLKDLLSFLQNFSQIQLFDLPASRLTIITRDAEKRETALDKVFSLSDLTGV